MSPLYFGLYVVCLFEARPQELDAVYTLATVPVFLEEVADLVPKTRALNMRKTSSSKFIDDIS